MTRRVAVSGARPVRISNLLNRLAANPLTLSFASFAVTALVIRSESFNLF